MKKGLSAGGILFQLVAVLCMFFDGFTTLDYYAYPRLPLPGQPIQEHTATHTSNGFADFGAGLFIHNECRVLVYFFFVVMLISLLFFTVKLIREIKGSNKKLPEFLNFLPLCAGVLMIVSYIVLDYRLFSLTHTDDEMIDHIFGLGVPYTVCLICQVLATVFGILLFVFRNYQKTSAKKISSANTGAEALLKYKALLDDGAITQEEYDNKKAEILKQ